MATRHNWSMRSEERLGRLRLLELGVVTTVVEALLLREGMTAFAGSELAWSLVLTTWLLGVALGARRGSATGADRLAEALGPMVVGLGAAGVVLLRALPALAGGTSGETAPAWHALWVWPAAVLPAALVGGLAFPILARRLEDSSPGRAYALEAGGACAGGIAFTLLLAPLGTAVTLAVIAGVVAAVRLWRRPMVALAAAVGFCAAGFPLAAQLEHAGWQWAGHRARLLEWAETRHQRLELAAGPPVTLFADGRLVASFPDPWQTGTRGHLLMLLSPRPRRVLALGAVEDGTVEVLLRHPLQRLDLVEEDPRLLELIPRWYGQETARALADPRVHRIGVDPLRAAARGGRWDLVLLLDPDPSTLRRNRTRTVELFSLLSDRLAPGGRLVVSTGVSDTYLGGAAGRLLAVLSATLEEAFPHVAAIPGDRILLVAGRERLDDVLSPEQLARRWRSRNLDDAVFSPELLPVLLDPSRALSLASFLSTATAPVNRIVEPAAVLPAMALAEGRGSTRLSSLLLRVGRIRKSTVLLVAAALAALLVLIGLRGPRSRGQVAAFAIGLASMGCFIILLAAWQSTRGSVYVEIGALTAEFMAGAALGALVASRRPDTAVRALPLLLLSLTAVALLLALGLPQEAPLSVPLFLAVAGALTGSAFPGAAALAGHDRPSAAAALGFSADEAGAATGALTTGLLLPVVGVPALALALAVLLAATAAISLLPNR